jgi:L-2-hydroxycarboxylate dehydrogenase (NAD+)
MPGVERIFMPGEQSHEKRVSQSKNGITLAPQLMKTLGDLAREIGIPPLKGN